jgi:hypothetical protein
MMNLNNISTGYVNGWTIYKAILSLGEDGNKAKKWLFFTEENTLMEAMNNKNNEYFYKPKIREGLIDDKLAFHDFLISIKEQPVPSYKIDEEYDEYPVYLKAKHSWRNGIKVPRGWLCYNLKELYLRIEKIREEGWDKEYFFLQKFLDYPVHNNISVSGYFDYLKPERNLSLVTRKTVGSSDRIAGGVIVESILDPQYLVQRTYSILSNLQYDSPFEMEYYLDESKGIYYVLELNPRFWMQHGIFFKFFDNGLIKRYLNLDTCEDHNQAYSKYNSIAWVDTIGMIVSCLKGNFKPLVKYLHLINNQVPILLAPDIITACKFVLKRASNEVLKTKFNEDLF